MPASCEQCGKIDLDPENFEAWEMYLEFPGLITSGPYGWEVRYNAAFKIMTGLYLSEQEQLAILRKLEAIRKGFSQSAGSGQGWGKAMFA